VYEGNAFFYQQKILIFYVSIKYKENFGMIVDFDFKIFNVVVLGVKFKITN